MAYQANIPQPTDQLSKSQGDILGNFQALFPFIQGVIDIPASAADPATTGDNIIFAKLYSVTGNDEVYIQNEFAGINYPITASGNGNTGWTFLPSGILLKWGSSSIGIAGGNIVVSQGPTYVAAYIVLVSSQSFNNTVSVTSVTTVGFHAQGTINLTPFFYLMIGLGTGD